MKSATMIDRMLPKMTISIFSIHKVNSFSWFVSSSELKAGVNFLHFLSLENRDQRFFISSMGLRGGLGTTGKAELSLQVLSKSRHITFWALVDIDMDIHVHDKHIFF